MKTKFYLTAMLSILLLSSCEYVEFNPENIDEPSEKEFTDWVNKFDAELAEAYYESIAESFMHDARLQNTDPFSIKDVVTWRSDKKVSGYDYHATHDAGTTEVLYKDDQIFYNSWNSGYMESHHTMTKINYGELGKIKVLFIANNSWFPADEKFNQPYYGTEKKLFTEIQGELHEYDLREMGVYVFSTEVKSTTKEGVIVINSTSFVRSYPRYNSYTFIHLPSKKFRTICTKFDY